MTCKYCKSEKCGTSIRYCRTCSGVTEMRACDERADDERWCNGRRC